MRLIYVDGDDDFAAVEFERYFNGKSVTDIIERFCINNEKHDGDFNIKLYEFDSIDPDFISFVRKNIEDYDFAKHSTFYCEGEIIRA